MKKQNIVEFKAKPTNVLIYDDENIMYYEGVYTYIETTANMDSGSYIDGSRYNYIMNHDIHLVSPNLESKENIKLDETTMKRIAKYNKEKECERLDDEIATKKEKIKELDNLLKDKEKRWNKVKEYIAKIYEIDLNDDYGEEWDD